MHYGDGRARVEPTGISDLDRVNGLGLTETYGPLVATNLGGVLRRLPDGTWQSVGASDIPQARFAFEANTRLFAAGSGLVAEIAPDGEPCAAAVTLSSEVLRLESTGPDTFMVMIHPDDAAFSELHFFRATGAPVRTCE